MSDIKPTNAAPPDDKPKPNLLFWRLLILPSILILAIAIGVYLLRPARDSFLSGATTGSYTLFSPYSTYSPYFWIGGPLAALFLLSFIISIARTVARREWRYWQRLLGLLALTAAGVLFLLTGLPDVGTSGRDASAVNYNGRNYHLFAQTIPASPGTDLRFSIFECDPAGVSCQRVYRDDIEYPAGERVPPLEVLHMDVYGIFLAVRPNSPEILSKYQP